MRSASPVAAIPCWRNSAAAADTIRSRVFAASLLDFLIVSHLLNGKLLIAVDFFIVAAYILDVDQHLKEICRRSRMSRRTFLVTGATGDTGGATVEQILA